MKRLAFLIAAFAFLCSSAHAAITRNGPPLTLEGNTSGGKIALPVAAAGDIVWCGVNPLYGSTASCSCIGGTAHAMDSQSFHSPAISSFIVEMALTGCAVGTDVITISSNGSPIEATVIDITGNPSIDVFLMSGPISVVAGGSIPTASLMAGAGDYCLSWATDAAGNGGAAQVPVGKVGNPPVAVNLFSPEGSPNDAYPENFSDYTQSSAGTVTAGWQYQGATPAGVVLLACFKPAPVVTSIRLCSTIDATQCMNFPAGVSTFGLNMYIVTNGVQSAAPVMTSSLTILPSQ